MKRALPIPLLLLLLSPALPGQEFRDDHETKHYFVRTTGTRDQAKELGEFMELVYRTYSVLLNYKKPLQKKFVIKLYKDHDEYARTTNMKQALAHYSPGSKELVGSYDPVGMFAIFAHEGMHQFTDMVMPSFQRSVQRGEVPTWYSEGIADCIGNSEARKGKLYMCTTTGYIYSMRILVIQSAVREKKYNRFRTLMYWNQRDFYNNNGRLNYATAWSFCHFLMTYPRKEDPSKQIPNGKYKKALVNFHNLMAAGKKRSEAYASAFGVRSPSDWDKFEEKWADYVLSLPDPLRDTPFEGITADLDKLGESDGVYVGEIDEKCAAWKSGLRSKDVVVGVDGAEVRHYGHFIPPLRAKKKGEKAVLKVRRGEETIDLEVPYP